METIYEKLSLDRIPWNIEEPPALLVELVESGGIGPCEAVDLGCGAGNYAGWLASKGFRVTGIDLSPRAIELAGQLANKRGVNCRFIVEDLTEDLRKLDRSFDFAYDWEVLHHVFPEKRQVYVRNVCRMLRPGGKYLSVSFSEEDRDFGGEGKYRETPLGTTLYCSSEGELRGLFEAALHVREISTSEITGKYGSHIAVVALMERG
jgi:SAM-dependent methyltransferase